MKHLMILGLVLITLSACETARIAAETGIAKKQTYNDNKAQLSLVLPCDMVNIGAYFRALTPSQQRAVEALCGGEPMPKRPVLAPEK